MSIHPRRIKIGLLPATDLDAGTATIFKSIGRKLTENTQEQKKVRSISQTNSRLCTYAFSSTHRRRPKVTLIRSSQDGMLFLCAIVFN
jgi:hypothetical protein